MIRALAILSVVGLAATAAAQLPAPEGEAEALYRRGMTSYHVGDFDAAIAQWKRAYELTQAPGLLFNLGQAARLKKDPERALFYYQTYLRLDPGAANRDDVEGFIAQSEQALARVAEELEHARPAPAPSRPIAAPAAAVEQPRAACRAPSRPPRRALAIAGMVTGALGLGLVAGGAALGVASNSASDELGRFASQGGSWDARHQALYHDGEREAIAATALYAIGGAAVATGIVLAIVGWHKRATRLAAIARAGEPAVVACAF
jgi:tetratricopeptide (TPR) repeat protein